MSSGLDNLVELKDLEAFAGALDKEQEFSIQAKTFCPRCKKINRFEVISERVSINGTFASGAPPRRKSVSNIQSYDASWILIKNNLASFAGSQFRFTCVTCHASGRSLVQKVSGRAQHLVFFNDGGSIATEHTPEIVRYYLEQAQSCNTVKAFSAVLAMFRTALDAVLFDAGYEAGMVGQKLKKLSEDLAADKGPAWAAELRVEYMTTIKNLGNSSLHVSDKDLGLERSITDSDILEIEAVFQRLLYLAYEKDAEENESLQRLKDIKAKRPN